MQELETRLKKLLTGVAEGEQAAIIREMKAVALESYRNGQKAGAPKREPRKAAKSPSAKAYQR